MKTFHPSLLIAGCALSALITTGCGGGNGEDPGTPPKPSNSDESGPVFAAPSLSGITAIGTALSNATITLKDRQGNTLVVNGKTLTNPLNQEVVTIRGIVPGEYVVNLHYYASETHEPVEAMVRVDRVNPVLKVVWYDKVVLEKKGDEKTALRFTVNEDGVLTVAAISGVLANDSDVDGDPLHTVLVSGPSNGTLTLNADGSFTYTPTPLFYGTDTFTYSVCMPWPNEAMCDTATETIVVGPNAVNDAYATPLNTPMTTGNVKTADTYPVGATFTKSRLFAATSERFSVDASVSQFSGNFSGMAVVAATIVRGRRSP